MVTDSRVYMKQCIICRKAFAILAVFIAAIMIAQEVSYAQIAAACMAARKIRKARQEQQGGERQNNFARTQSSEAEEYVKADKVPESSAKDAVEVEALAR